LEKGWAKKHPDGGKGSSEAGWAKKHFLEKSVAKNNLLRKGSSEAG